MNKVHIYRSISSLTSLQLPRKLFVYIFDFLRVEIQKQGQLRSLPLGMRQEDIKKSITMLNQLLEAMKVLRVLGLTFPNRTP